MHSGALSLTTTGYQGQEVAFEVPFLAFPTKTGRIIVHAPGTGEQHEGRRNRHVRLGEHLAERGIASLVAFKPPFPDEQYKYPGEPYSYKGASWNRIYIQSMARMVLHCIQDAAVICGGATPEVYLSGFSTGGSVAMAVAPLFPKVQKVLLVSAYDSVGDYFYKGAASFTGEIYAACGGADMPAVVLAEGMDTLAASAKVVHARTIPGFSHGFGSQEDRGRTLCQAFLWAFAGEAEFPSPAGGIPLEAAPGE